MPKTVKAVNPKSGNTKQISQKEVKDKVIKSSEGPQSKHWCFTLYNYKCEAVSDFLLDSGIEYYRCQEEICPKTKREHIQGYIITSKVVRRGYIWKLTGGKTHCNPCWNGKGSFDYCLKDDTRKPNGMQWDNMPATAVKVAKRPLRQITEDMFTPYQIRWHKLFKTEPSSRWVWWFWESIGKIGKSAYVNYIIDNHPGEYVFFDGGKYEDLMMVIAETNMDQVRAILWDMPRETKGRISTRAIESLQNGRIRSTKYEGGFKRFADVHIIVWSNHYPCSDAEDNLSSDRWKIIEIKGNLEDKIIPQATELDDIYNEFLND